MKGSRKLLMLVAALATLLGLGGLSWLGKVPDAVVLGLAGQVPILVGACVAGNAAEHVAARKETTP